MASKKKRSFRLVIGHKSWSVLGILMLNIIIELYLCHWDVALCPGLWLFLAFTSSPLSLVIFPRYKNSNLRWKKKKIMVPCIVWIHREHKQALSTIFGWITACAHLKLDHMAGESWITNTINAERTWTERYMEIEKKMDTNLVKKLDCNRST